MNRVGICRYQLSAPVYGGHDDVAVDLDGIWVGELKLLRCFKAGRGEVAGSECDSVVPKGHLRQREQRREEHTVS